MAIIDRAVRLLTCACFLPGVALAPDRSIVPRTHDIVVKPLPAK